MLLLTGLVDDIDDALRYYGWKRFSSGIGVTQPCQLRYIYYFDAILRNRIVAPVVKKLKAIIIKALPREDNSNLQLEIYNIQTTDNNSIPDDILVFSSRMYETDI